MVNFNFYQDVLKSFDLGNDMEVYEIDNDPEMNKIQDFMAKSTGARSVSLLLSKFGKFFII